MKMKLLIGATALLSNLAGIGRYTNEIAKRLINKDIETRYFYGYYSKHLMTPNANNKMKGIKNILASNSFVKKIARKLLVVISHLFAPKFDLYWEPCMIPLVGIKASQRIVTVHDFSCYLYPQWHPKENVEYFNQYFFKNVRRSDWIITGSEFSKEEIVQYLDFDKEKISVIYHGVDLGVYRVYPEMALEETKEKFKLPQHFLLFVGSIEPRKNLSNLLKAYHLLPDAIKEVYSLVLVGPKGWENEDVMRSIEQEKEDIKYLGYVSDEAMAHIYNLATLFVYPSLYEGFGIPPLEAMACGTAVVSSNAASLPEVCGEAALYIDPHNIEALKDKIERLLEDKVLQQALIAKGLARVKHFTWEKSAQAHLKVFESVLKDKRK